jgi:hypothetical protein
MDTKSGVTSINDLPSGENVKISIEEKSESVNMNDIFKEIQSTGSSGNIPSRDIPINPNNVILDETSKPNFIPKHEDYINEDEFESGEEIIDKKRRNENKKASIEVMYEELQVPILLGVIYFFFQLPVFNNSLAKYLSFTFDADGGINLSGLVLKSVLYAGVYYILTKVLINVCD